MNPRMPIRPTPPQPFLPPYPGSGLTMVHGPIIPGTVMAYACDIDPKTYLRTSGNLNEPREFSPTVNNDTGWILCDGSSVYESEFPILFDIIGYTYGKGEKQGQFKVPDYRGFFMRGLDTDDDKNKLDLNIDKRKAYSNGAKGSVSGASTDAKGVGSTQECMVQMHEHHYNDYPGESKVSGTSGAGAGDVKKTADNVTYDLLINNEVVPEAEAKETRPVNIYVNYIIYAGLPGGKR